MKSENKYQLKHYRKLLHILSGIIAIAYYFFSVKEHIFIYLLYIIIIGILLLDILRMTIPIINDFVFKYLHHFFINREREKINSAAYYFIGVLFCVYFFPVEVAVSSILFLSLGDSTASFVGTHWGKHKFIKEKTLEGSTGCLIMCFLIAMIFLPLQISLIGAIVATSSEVLPWNLDDNLTVPVFSGIAMTLLY